MLRFLLVALLLPAAHAFVVAPKKHASTALQVSRRDVIFTGIGSILAAPQIAHARESASSTFFFEDENVSEPSQQATSGKLDLNAAFVVRPRCFGPHVHVHTIDASLCKLQVCRNVRHISVNMLTTCVL